jgi:hypothetical protein
MALVGIAFIAVGCPCPTIEPYPVDVQENPALAALVEEAMIAREQLYCDEACEPAEPDYPGSWRCTLQGPIEAPSEALCEPLQPTEEMDASYRVPIEPFPGGSAVYPLKLDPADCRTLCQLSDAWPEAAASGRQASSIQCGYVEGSELDDVLVECFFAGGCQ